MAHHASPRRAMCNTSAQCQINARLSQSRKDAPPNNNPNHVNVRLLHHALLEVPFQHRTAESERAKWADDLCHVHARIRAAAAVDTKYSKRMEPLEMERCLLNANGKKNPQASRMQLMAREPLIEVALLSERGMRACRRDVDASSTADPQPRRALSAAASQSSLSGPPRRDPDDADVCTPPCATN